MSTTSTPYVLGGATGFLSVASSVLTAIVATALQDDGRKKGLVYFAFVLQLLSLLLVLLYSTWYARRIGNDSLAWEVRKLLGLVGIGVLVTILGAVVTTASIAWIKITSHGAPHMSFARSSNAIFLVWCIVWGVSVFCQLVFYGYLVWWTCQRKENRSVHRLSRDFGNMVLAPEKQETERPQTTETVKSITSRDHALSSPPRTPTSSDAISSFRSSLSRTKLLTRQRSFPRDSKSSSFDLPSRERPSQEEAFDTWDTSDVGPQIREAILHSSPNSARAPPLEPIPGSRPESPANALDGPFLPQSPHQSPTSLASSPVNFSRPTSRHRAPSVEDHIHPLFRTSSPTPPPTATPGTTVTAAPIAGQTISSRTLNRMRSGSLPSTPSPLAKSQGAPSEVIDLPPSPPPSSPPPAIPGFVLSAGSRSSLVGYGKRKTLRAPSEEDEVKSVEEEGDADTNFF